MLALQAHEKALVTAIATIAMLEDAYDSESGML